MFDINFLMRVHELKREIVSGRVTNPVVIAGLLESFRDCRPWVFNIETTNACNMTCRMCPRTELMTRGVETMKMDLFLRVIDQMIPHSAADLFRFAAFVADQYGIRAGEQSENAFYFDVSARCVTLHGYGEPPLDKLLPERIRACAQRGLPTYFSCVPSNIEHQFFTEAMSAGATVIKFAIDALDDDGMRRIRGRHASYATGMEKIAALLEWQAAHGTTTKFVATMIALSDDDAARETQRRFLETWRGTPVFAYVKSRDNRWFHDDDAAMVNRSHYEAQYCEYPWTSLSVMANGAVVPCTQDYNNEMVMGDAARQTLASIWNSTAYDAFQAAHITGKFPAGWKCADRCDQKMVCTRLGTLSRATS